jgi:hypothetical protein
MAAVVSIRKAEKHEKTEKKEREERETCKEEDASKDGREKEKRLIKNSQMLAKHVPTVRRVLPK